MYDIDLLSSCPTLLGMLPFLWLHYKRRALPATKFSLTL